MNFGVEASDLAGLSRMISSYPTADTFRNNLFPLAGDNNILSTLAKTWDSVVKYLISSQEAFITKQMRSLVRREGFVCMLDIFTHAISITAMDLKVVPLILKVFTKARQVSAATSLSATAFEEFKFINL